MRQSCAAAVVAGVVVGTHATGLFAANWIPGNGNWNDASKWSPANVPDTTSETAVITRTQTGNSIVTLNSAYTIGGLTLGGGTYGGTIVGAYNLTAGTLNWTSGVMMDHASTTITGSANIYSDWPYTVSMTDRVLNLQGATTFFAATPYYMVMGGDAAINNSGTFSFTGGEIHANDGNRFNNTGILRAVAGTDSRVANVTSSNTVSAQSGTFNVGLLNNGISSGTFNATAGNTLALGLSTIGSHTFNNASFTGAGKISFAYGTYKTIGTLNATGGTIEIDGGTLTGNYSINNLSWLKSGFGDGTLSTNATVNGTTTIALENSSALVNGATVTLQGNTNQNNFANTTTFTRNLVLSNGTVINNNGVYTLADNTSIQFVNGSTGNNGRFNNNNTLVKTGGTLSAVSGLVNSGTVSSQSGTLYLGLLDNVASTGNFNATANNTIQFNGSDTDLFNGASFSGAGKIVFDSGSYHSTGVSTSTASTFQLNQATLGGNFTLANFTWNGGNIASTTGGQITVTGAANLAFTYNIYPKLTGQTLRLQGNTTFATQSSTPMYLNGNATLVNTGTFTLTGNLYSANGGNVFNTLGTLQANTYSGTAYDVVNAGTVNAGTGSLLLHLLDGGTSTGNFTVGTGQYLYLMADGTHTLSSTVQISGAGTLNFDGTGTLTAASPLAVNTGSARFTSGTLVGSYILPGLTWYRGTFGGTSGTATVTGASTFSAFANTDLIVSGRALALQNTTTQTATDGRGLLLAGNATVNNSGTYVIADDSEILATGSGNTFNNTGTLRKNGTAGVSTAAAVVNAGTLSAQTGTFNVSLAAGGSGGGIFSAAANATLNLTTPSVYTFNGSLFDAVGTVRLTSGTFNTGSSATVFGSKFTLDGATLNGTWAAPVFTWNSGQLAGTGANTFTVNTTATLAANANTFLNVNSRVLNLSGNTTQTATTGYGVRMTGSATINNSGVYTLADDSNIASLLAGNTFNNSGTLRKSGGSGVSVVAALANTGTVAVTTGELNLSLLGNGTSSGTFDTAVRTRMTLDAPAPHTFTSAAVLRGGGTFRFPGRVFTFPGTVQTSGLTFDVADNTASPDPDLTLAGVIQSATNDGFRKTGTGTLAATGTATYAGTTDLAGGTLTTVPGVYNNFLTNANGLYFTADGVRARLDYGRSGASSPIATVKALLTAAYASEFLNGQIRSSVAGDGHTLGYGDDGSSVTILATLTGDADLDGDVDFNDFLALQSSFGNAGTRFDQGNFNYDNLTDFNDFLALQANFGLSVGGDSVAVTDQQVAAMTAFATSVPEPAALAAAAIGVAGVLVRRRRAGIVAA